MVFTILFPLLLIAMLLLIIRYDWIYDNVYFIGLPKGDYPETTDKRIKNNKPFLVFFARLILTAVWLWFLYFYITEIVGKR